MDNELFQGAGHDIGCGKRIGHECSCGLVKTVKQRTRDKILKVEVSPMFAAILDAILDVEPRRTKQALAEVKVTSDGILLGMTQGDIGFNQILGSASDLYRNCQGIAEAAKLTKKERTYLLSEVSALEGSL